MKDRRRRAGVRKAASSRRTPKLYRFAIGEIVRHFAIRAPYFWATHAGAELDLLATIGGRRYGFECKYRDAPGSTRSMRVALEELRLKHLFVIHPGSKTYPLQEKITAVPLSRLADCGMTAVLSPES